MYAMEKRKSILTNYTFPGDLKKLSHEQLRQLADEIRKEILHTISQHGGHLSSNLGVVELTIALHRVFDSSADSIVWDVGHQCYAHKLLTGRLDSFSTIRQRGGISGFPKINESIHDAFGAGHASVSVSAALGIARAKKMNHDSSATIAVIGDGALTGGLAFEGIANACSVTDNLIIILNDNGFSISKNKSYFSKHLSKLTIGKRYQNFKLVFDTALSKIPLLGPAFLNFIRRIKRSIKSFSFSNNFFVDFGFEYVGPINGHDIRELESVLKKVKQLRKPVVVHVKTVKGAGYSFAEKDPATFHGISAFNIADGKWEHSIGTTFSKAFSKSLCSCAEHNPRIVGITAAMLGGTGLQAFGKKFPTRIFDVGIAEGHAVTFAAGLASKGIRPVVALYSTFLQRAIDNVIHDVALQNLPVVFAIDRAGAVSSDGPTHQGAFDISLLRCIPNVTLLAPASERELSAMLSWALTQHGPVVIRYPKATCPPEIPAFSEPLVCGRGLMLKNTEQAKILIVLCTGSLYPQAMEAVSLLAEENILCDMYHLRFIKPLDEKYFLTITERYNTLLFVEEGSKLGGIARELELLVQKNRTVKTAVIGFADAFLAQGTRAEILEEQGLSAAGIALAVEELNDKKGYRQ